MNYMVTRNIQIGVTAVFLASEGAAAIRGDVIAVAGGI